VKYLLAFLILLAPSVGLADSPSQILMVENCRSCHHPDVNGLSHLSEAQIAERLIEFKNNTRPSTIMNRITSSFSEEDLRNLSKLVKQFYPDK